MKFVWPKAWCSCVYPGTVALPAGMAVLLQTRPCLQHNNVFTRQTGTTTWPHLAAGKKTSHLFPSWSECRISAIISSRIPLAGCPLNLHLRAMSCTTCTYSSKCQQSQLRSSSGKAFDWCTPEIYMANLMTFPALIQFHHHWFCCLIGGFTYFCIFQYTYILICVIYMLLLEIVYLD